MGEFSCFKTVLTNVQFEHFLIKLWVGPQFPCLKTHSFTEITRGFERNVSCESLRVFVFAFIYVSVFLYIMLIFCP